MSTVKKYWKSVDQLDQKNPIVENLEQNEFPNKLPQDFNKDDSKIEDASTSRRDFLKYAGFTTVAATVAFHATLTLPTLLFPDEVSKYMD